MFFELQRSKVFKKAVNYLFTGKAHSIFVFSLRFAHAKISSQKTVPRVCVLRPSGRFVLSIAECTNSKKERPPVPRSKLELVVALFPSFGKCKLKTARISPGRRLIKVYFNWFANLTRCLAISSARNTLFLLSTLFTAPDPAKTLLLRRIHTGFPF